MKNKRGIFGAIFLAIIIVLFLAALLIYFQVKKNGLTLSSGDVTIKINYNKSTNQAQIQNNNSISEDLKINNTEANNTLENETLKDKNSTFLIIEEVNQSQ